MPVGAVRRGTTRAGTVIEVRQQQPEIGGQSAQRKIAAVGVCVVLLSSMVVASSDDQVFVTELVVSSTGDVVVDRLTIANGTPTQSRLDGHHADLPFLNVRDEWQNEHYLVLREGTTIHAVQPVTLQFQDWTPYLNENETVVETEKLLRRLPYTRNAEYLHLVRGSDESLLDVHLPSRMCVDDGTCSPYCQGRGIDPDCDDYNPYKGVGIAMFLAGMALILSAYIIRRRQDMEEEQLPFWR